MEPIRILHIVDCIASNSGVSSVIMNWYRNIDKKKIQFDFLVCCKRKDSYEAEILNNGGQIYYLQENESYDNFLKLIKSTKVFFKNNAYKYNITHLHSPTLVGIMFYYAKKYGIKNRIIHSHSISYADSKIKNFRNKILLLPMKFLSTEYVSCSKLAGDFLFKKNYHIVQNGINFYDYEFNEDKRAFLRNQFGVKDEEILIGHISNMSDLKRVDLVLIFLEELLDYNNKIKLVLCGKNELPDKINNIIQQKDLNKYIINLGIRNDIPDIMSALDICYMPSEKEGLGLVAVECQANNLTVAVSNGFPEDVFVSDLIFRLENYEIKDIYSLILKIKKQGRKKTDLFYAKNRFDIKYTVKDIEKIYRTCIL